MRELINAGIYFSQPSNNHSCIFDYRELIEYVKDITHVKACWNSNKDLILNSEWYTSEISAHSLERIIIAGYQPGYLKSFFAKVMKNAGANPENIVLIDFHEQLESNGNPMDYAKALLMCAVFDISFESLHEDEFQNNHTETLVIGGGIAGIQAALEIANSHNKVYLVEKTGTIGGYMAMFDKTFPTLDCAACILTPKMVEVSQHPYIELLTYSEVQKVEGIPGDYKVKILKKARRVDEKSCTGCGTCAEKCPSSVKSEFDSGTTMRKAIYMPFPQAVPNKYLIDADSCRYVQNGKCGTCVKVCPVENCIDLDATDIILDIEVGNIVVTTGFKTFDATRMEQYGYGKYPNVLTSIELERLINASGPTGGKITLRSQDKKGNWIFNAEGEEPKSVALIHCVGSRDINHNTYCSRVCCMYSLKLAHLVKEKLPNADVFEYYIDMRAFGKGYEEFYTRIKEEGVQIIRGKTAKIEQEDNKLLLRTEDIEQGRLLEQVVDMTVLAVGLEPASESNQLAKQLNIPLSADGWMKENYHLGNSTESDNGGIFMAGACQGPKDIPDSVVQASAAAAKVVQNIMKNKISNNLKTISLESVENKVKEISL